MQTGSHLWFCVSTRPWSMSVRASAVSPDIAHAMCSSISRIFSMLLGSCSGSNRTRERSENRPQGRNVDCQLILRQQRRTRSAILSVRGRGTHEQR